MKYLSGAPDKCLQIIERHIIKRLSCIKGGDRVALIAEFKEWLWEECDSEADIWTIPDLTDEGLRDFFRRAITKK